MASYPSIREFEQDSSKLLKRKEFYYLRNDSKVDFRFKADIYGILKDMGLILQPYQLFSSSFINPTTDYDRILLEYQTGTGKTITAAVIAQNFIKVYEHIYNQQIQNVGTSKVELDKSTPTVFVFGFSGTKTAFQRDLLNYTEFGFVTQSELEQLNELKSKSRENPADAKWYQDFKMKLRKRITSKDKGGFYKFYGYKEFVNRLFKSDEVDLVDVAQAAAKSGKNVKEMVDEYIQQGKVQINEQLLDRFKNSLVICDEVHNIYNMQKLNNYGFAIQYVLDHHPSARAVLLSATPINNSSTEIVDLLNLLGIKVDKKELFAGSKLLPGALEKIGKLSVGKVSFVQSINPKEFPTREFVGEPMKYNGKDIPYLRFTPVKISSLHEKTLIKFAQKGNETYEDSPQGWAIPPDGHTIYDGVFPNPTNNEVGLFRSKETKSVLTTAEQGQKDKAMIKMTQKTPSNIIGDFLKRENIGKYFAKYKTFLDDLLNMIKNQLKGYKGNEPETRGEKYMIYHNKVGMSGVLLIQEMLKINNFIDEYSTPVDNTICGLCGGSMKSHDKYIKEHNLPKHQYTPARFCIVHARGIDKTTMEKTIDNFNTPDNKFGINYKLIIGSKVLEESRELKDVRKVFIMALPVNVSALIQVLGRSIRQGSHINLPPEMRKVEILFYISIMDKANSPELTRYYEKLTEYVEIQKIIRELRKNSVDINLYPDITMTENTSDNLFNLQFQPARTLKTYNPTELNMTTFSAYKHYEYEIKLIILYIKKLFLIHPVWKYDDLFRTIKEPPFPTKVNPALFSEESFVVALNKLVQKGIEKEGMTSILYDPHEQYIKKDGINYKIDQIADYYILFPFRSGKMVQDIDSYNRPLIQKSQVNINLTAWSNKFKDVHAFNLSKNDFTNKLKNNTVENIYLEYDSAFYVLLLKDLIVNLICKETISESYSKVLEFFDKFTAIIYVDDVMRYRGVLKNFAGKLFKFSNGQYSTKLNKDYPIGFLQKESIILYDAPRWIEVSKASMNIRTHFIENDTIIGYIDNIGGGMKFKLRKPLKFSTTITDIRKIEKGMVCYTKDKNDLVKLMKELKIAPGNKDKIRQMCDKIMTKMLELESRERLKDGKIKYVYMPYDSPPKIGS